MLSLYIYATACTLAITVICISFHQTTTLYTRTHGILHVAVIYNNVFATLSTPLYPISIHSPSFFLSSLSSRCTRSTYITHMHIDICTKPRHTHRHLLDIWTYSGMGYIYTGARCGYTRSSSSSA